MGAKEDCESRIHAAQIRNLQFQSYIALIRGMICARDRVIWEQNGMMNEKSQAQNCLPPVSDHKFTVKSSPNGGVDIDFRCATIHAPKSLSVHHPLIQMVLFANHLHDYEFSCPKSMAPKSITDMVERRQSYSASPAVYEAGWVPAKPRRERSEAVLHPVSVTERLHRSAADAEGSAGSVLATATSLLHQHRSLNNQTDEPSDKQQRSDRRPATNSSDEAKRVAEARKLTDQGSEHRRSDPNSCVAERDTMEEAKRSGEWFVATGTAHHATWNRNLIRNLEALENDGLYVHAADGTPMPVCGRGDVVTDDVVLPDVYYVPGLCTNLVSVGQLAGLDYSTSFSRGSCVFSSAAGTVAGTAHARGDGLYQVDFLRVPPGMP